MSVGGKWPPDKGPISGLVPDEVGDLLRPGVTLGTVVFSQGLLS